MKNLKTNRLCLAPDKCEWGINRVEFLGYMISGTGLEMTDDKIQMIKDIKTVTPLRHTGGYGAPGHRTRQNHRSPDITR